MILYHGSTVIVDKPRIIRSHRALDFGAGFYTTESQEQSERWAKNKMRREQSSNAIVSIYEFDLESAKKELIIRTFEYADAQWLDFVMKNRAGEKIDNAAALCIGPVADDNVYATIRLFETGILDAEETVKRLKTEVLNNQVTFHTNAALHYCHYLKSYEL